MSAKAGNDSSLEKKRNHNLGGETMKKTLAILLAVVMAITLFTACGNNNTPANDTKTGSVYYLNFKPEADQAWQDLAKLYTEKTGVPVTVLTGGIFMIWADVAAKTLVPKKEIPIGIITSVIGAPVFLIIMLRRAYGFGGKD